MKHVLLHEFIFLIRELLQMQIDGTLNQYILELQCLRRVTLVKIVTEIDDTEKSVPACFHDCDMKMREF